MYHLNVSPHAVTCIFLAVEMEEAQLPYETYWVLTAHVCCYVGAQLLLTVSHVIHIDTCISFKIMIFRNN